MLLIKDICKITGLNSSAIRYYEKQNLLGDVKRQANNYRIFGKSDVKKLLFIKQARGLGFDLEEIKRILDLKESGISPCNYVKEKMQEKISLIEIEVSKLKKEKEKLKKSLYQAEQVSGCKGFICHYIEGSQKI